MTRARTSSCFLDIGATPGSRETMVAIVEKVSEQVFIPLSVGGGRPVGGRHEAAPPRRGRQGRRLLGGAPRSGAPPRGRPDVRLPVHRPVDRREEGRRLLARLERTAAGRTRASTPSNGRSRREELGAGEILLNSIDRDGTKEGYDIDLVRAVSERVSIPVIASGGAGTLEQIAGRHPRRPGRRRPPGLALP